MQSSKKVSYKKLPIKKEEVLVCFDEYKIKLMPSLEWSVNKNISNGSQYLFRLNGEENLINVYFNNNDTTTFTPTGKDSGIVIPICDYIYSQYNNDGMKGINQSFNNFPQKTFKLIIEYFDEKENVKHIKKEIANGQYHCFNFRGERLVINYYSTKTLLLQGKANMLFSDVIYFLITSNYNSNDVLALEQSLHKTCFDSTIDIEGELKSKLPKAYGYLSQEHLKLIRPSLRNVLNSVNHDPDDNSCIAHSILRGTEQILKSYLFQHGVEGIRNANSFYGFISKKDVKLPVSEKITEEYKQKAIIGLYTFYCDNRHVIEHTKAISEDTVIKTCHDSYKLVYDALNAINDFYDTVI